MSPIRPLHESLKSSIAAQMAVVLLCWLAGAAFVRLSGAPLSASLVGFVLLLGLLATGLLPLACVGRGADWLLSRMLVFFVPAVLAVLEYPAFVGWLGLRILAVIVGSTLAVMLVTMRVVKLFEGRGAQESDDDH